VRFGAIPSCWIEVWRKLLKTFCAEEVLQKAPLGATNESIEHPRRNYEVQSQTLRQKAHTSRNMRTSFDSRLNKVNPTKLPAESVELGVCFQNEKARPCGNAFAMQTSIRDFEYQKPPRRLTSIKLLDHRGLHCIFFRAKSLAAPRHKPDVFRTPVKGPLVHGDMDCRRANGHAAGLPVRPGHGFLLLDGPQRSAPCIGEDDESRSSRDQRGSDP